MGPSYGNLFVGYVEHQFFNQYDGPKPDLYGRYIDDCIGAISSSREELNRFITSVNSFHPALKYTWEISETSLAFLDIKVSISSNGLRLVCTTNPQILTVICCIHYPTHPMSRIPFPILNFLDSDVCAVMNLIFLANLKKCASFSKNVAILLLSFKQPITALNKLIDSQHYKRHKRKRMTEFHLPSHFILAITQLKLSSLTTLKYSKMILKLVQLFRNHR